MLIIAEIIPEKQHIDQNIKIKKKLQSLVYRKPDNQLHKKNKFEDQSLTSKTQNATHSAPRPHLRKTFYFSQI